MGSGTLRLWIREADPAASSQGEPELPLLWGPSTEWSVAPVQGHSVLEVQGSRPLQSSLCVFKSSGQRPIKIQRLAQEPKAASKQCSSARLTAGVEKSVSFFPFPGRTVMGGWKASSPALTFVLRPSWLSYGCGYLSRSAHSCHHYGSCLLPPAPCLDSGHPQTKQN